MTVALEYLVATRFEAARAVAILPVGHRSRRLHGHSFLAKVRVTPSRKSNSNINLHDIETALHQVCSRLDYRLLNEVIDVPTDENIARWIRSECGSLIGKNEIQVTGIQSTSDHGADIDPAGNVHVWHRFRFEAAHVLPNVPKGHQCGRMHGHGFEIVLHANQDLTPQDHMSVDFDFLASEWSVLGELLDRSCLNRIIGLENPTSEMIAKWIWDRLKPRIPQLSWVTVYETVTAGCHYNGQRHCIWKEFRFEAALLDSRVDIPETNIMIGHSYLLRLHLSSQLNPVLAWTVDYGDVKRLFDPIYKKLDHHCLTDESGIDGPECEHVARWIHSQAVNVLPQLDRIDLFETPSAGVSLSWGSNAPALPS